jgi:hypothetical protein
MLMKLISRIKTYFKPIVQAKLYARSQFHIKKQGMLTYDNMRIEFRDNETKRRYMLRPIGMPLPLIVDELKRITGNLESAMDIYRKFCQAAANVTQHKNATYKIKVDKLF